jgi:four helix bundle protein
MGVATYRDLIVWQKAKDLAKEVYILTEDFPDVEKYGLSSQMRRAAISIASNIAEGRRRSTRKDFRQFLCISFGSGAELETQIAIAKELRFSSKLDYSKVDSLLDEVMRMLNVMIQKIQATS